MPQFIGTKIKVETQGEIRKPASFTWDKVEYQIREILVSWFDWGFPAGAKQKDWRSRRHRNYFRVRTKSDELFEIYLDRATPSGATEWYLFQKLDPEPASKQNDNT
jgi:hypothetical protein